MLRSAAHEARPLHTIPSALERFSDVAEALVHRRLHLFLDFDGTLARIVPDPEVAALEPPTRSLLEALAALIPVAILSGRERGDVERRVGLAGVVYAGSHGLDIQGPGLAHQVGTGARPALERAGGRLGELPGTYPGVQIEAKTFGLAVHYRRMESGSIEDLEKQVVGVAGDEPTLKMIRGKKVFELRPDLEWDKGDALMWLEHRFVEDRVDGGPGGNALADSVPMYLGDDVTDEDAFAALGPEGLSIVVRGEDDGRTSLARFALEGPEQVFLFLGKLLALTGPHGV